MSICNRDYWKSRKCANKLVWNHYGLFVMYLYPTPIIIRIRPCMLNLVHIKLLSKITHKNRYNASNVNWPYSYHYNLLKKADLSNCRERGAYLLYNTSACTFENNWRVMIKTSGSESRPRKVELASAHKKRDDYRKYFTHINEACKHSYKITLPHWYIH